jgi:aminoglycoside phosphotransferase (APT) family kinase protein
MTVADEFKSEAKSIAQDWDAVAHWAASQEHDLAINPAPRQFAGGVGNLNYLIQFDGKDAVLRRPPPGPRPAGANDMAREYRVLKALEGSAVQSPLALAFCSDEAIIGAPFLISSFCAGRIIRGAQFTAPAQTMSAVSKMMIDQLAALHVIDVEKAGLTDLGKPEGFAARTLQGWTKRAAAANDGVIPSAAEPIIAWLEANIPDAPSRSCLLHNDFKLDNIIVDADNPSLPRAVLDWDQATLGDPLFDLATLLSYWTEAGDPPILMMMQQMPSMAEGFLSREEAVAYYAELTGASLSGFRFFRVLAQFKLAVVVLQLHARYRQAPDSFPQFAPLAPVADALFAFCDDLKDGKRF